jgi:hypothetical protein
METETIDVPKFNGYEAFYGIPGEHDDCYILIEDGSNIIHKDDCSKWCLKIAQICYRKIKPKRVTFEFTGEVRPPKRGEWHKGKNGDYEKARWNYETCFEIYVIVEEQS